MARQFHAQDGTIIVPAAIEIDIFHYAIHAGLGFHTSHHVDVANAATMSIDFKTPAAGTQIHILPEMWVEAEATFYIREAPTIQNPEGTIKAAYDRNRITANTTAMEEFTTGSWVAGNVGVDGTINAAGTIINGGGAGQGLGIGKFSGGSQDASHEWLLNPATVYRFEVLNNTVSNNEVYLELNWFEVLKEKMAAAE